MAATCSSLHSRHGRFAYTSTAACCLTLFLLAATQVDVASASRASRSGLPGATVQVVSSASAPTPWPSSFSASFTETVKYLFIKSSTSGRLFYDFPYERMDRENGEGDRYCGTATGKKLKKVSCSHVVTNGTQGFARYLVFGDGDCCFCCSTENGCGATKPDWAANGEYQGQDTVAGVVCDKFSVKGLQTNLYWIAANASSTVATPVRLLQKPDDDMIFSDVSVGKFDPSTFALPGKCDKSCGGTCALVGARGDA
ncbi:hypothetical protein NFJ02_01g38790 [Pycnococcus provasolii]